MSIYYLIGLVMALVVGYRIGVAHASNGFSFAPSGGNDRPPEDEVFDSLLRRNDRQTDIILAATLALSSDTKPENREQYRQMFWDLLFPLTKNETGEENS